MNNLPKFDYTFRKNRDEVFKGVGNYMKLFTSENNYNYTIDQEHFDIPTILDDLKITLRDLEIAYARLDYVTDSDLIECYIYEVNSLLKRYKYLREEAVRQGALPQNHFLFTKLYSKPSI